MFKFTEGEHTSWPVDATDAHHCHLALKAVPSVEFPAEIVPCQRSLLSYTVRFLVAGGCRTHHQPNVTADDVVMCDPLYLESTDRLIARKKRSKPLRANALGRVPPRVGGRICT